MLYLLLEKFLLNQILNYLVLLNLQKPRVVEVLGVLIKNTMRSHQTLLPVDQASTLSHHVNCTKSIFIYWYYTSGIHLFS